MLGLMFRADVGPASKIFVQRQTLLLPVSVEAVDLIDS